MRKSLIVVCALAISGAAVAQTAPTGGQPPAARSLVSVTATETPLRDVARSLSEQSGRRILIGPDATGRLTMNVTGVSLDAALSVIARVSNNRWSRVSVPADRASALTAAQALALVKAADTLASSAVSVQSGEGPTVTVGAPAEAEKGAVSVYIIHAKANAAAAKPAGEEKPDEQAEEETPTPGVAAAMSEDARQDPRVVGAYSALQTLSPNQIAMLTREYLIHTTPEMRQSLIEALSQQAGPVMDVIRSQEGRR